MKKHSLLRRFLEVAIVGVLLMIYRNAAAEDPYAVIERRADGWIIEVGPRTSSFSSIANPDFKAGLAYRNATGQILTWEVIRDTEENYRHDKFGHRLEPKFIPFCKRFDDGWKWKASRDITVLDACKDDPRNIMGIVPIPGPSDRLFIPMRVPETPQQELETVLSTVGCTDKATRKECLASKAEKPGPTVAPSFFALVVGQLVQLNATLQGAVSSITTEIVEVRKDNVDLATKNTSLVAANASLNSFVGRNWWWSLCLGFGLVCLVGRVRERRRTNKHMGEFVRHPHVRALFEKLAEKPVLMGEIDMWVKNGMQPVSHVHQAATLPADKGLSKEVRKDLQRLEREKKVLEGNLERLSQANATLLADSQRLETEKATLAKESERLIGRVEGLTRVKGELTERLQEKAAVTSTKTSPLDQELDKWIVRLSAAATNPTDRCRLGVEFHQWCIAHNDMLPPHLRVLGVAAGEYADMAKAQAAEPKGPAKPHLVLVGERSGTRPSPTDSALPPETAPAAAKVAELEREISVKNGKIAGLESQLTGAEGAIERERTNYSALKAEKELLHTQFKQAESDRDTADAKLDELQGKVMNLEVEADSVRQLREHYSKLALDNERLQGKLKETVHGILTTLKGHVGALFSKFDEYLIVDAEVKAVQMPEVSSDFDTLDLQKARQELAAKKQKRDELRAEVGAAFWLVFEYQKKTLDLHEDATLLGFYRIASSILEDHRKKLAAQNNTLQPGPVVLAKAKELVANAPHAASAGVSISTTAKGAGGVMASQPDSSAADITPEQRVDDIVDMPPQSRVPTIQESAEMEGAPAAPADPAKQPFRHAADAATPIANKPREERIHTNPYGLQAAAVAAAAEEPRKTWPSPMPLNQAISPPPGWAPSPPPPSSAGTDKPKVPSEPETPEKSEIRGMPASPDDTDPADEPADDGAVADPPTHTTVVTKAGVAKPDRPSKKGRKHRAGGE